MPDGLGEEARTRSIHPQASPFVRHAFRHGCVFAPPLRRKATRVDICRMCPPSILSQLRDVFHQMVLRVAKGTVPISGKQGRKGCARLRARRHKAARAIRVVGFPPLGPACMSERSRGERESHQQEISAVQRMD